MLPAILIVRGRWEFGMHGYEGPNRFRYSRSGTMMLKESIDDNTSAEQLSEQDLRIYELRLKHGR